MTALLKVEHRSTFKNAVVFKIDRHVQNKSRCVVICSKSCGWTIHWSCSKYSLHGRNEYVCIRKYMSSGHDNQAGVMSLNQDRLVIDWPNSINPQQEAMFCAKLLQATTNLAGNFIPVRRFFVIFSLNFR